MAFLLGFTVLYWAVVAAMAVVFYLFGIPGIVVWAGLIYTIVVVQSVQRR